jgi:hypothetical protein
MREAALVRGGLQRAGKVGDDLGHFLRVGGGFRRAVHRLLEARGRDEFHCPGNLPDVANRLQSFNDRAGFGH